MTQSVQPDPHATESITGFLYGEPVLIDERTADRFESMPVVAEKVDPVAFGFFSLLDDERDPPFSLVGSVGVISISGAIVRRSRWQVSYESIAESLRAALGSAKVEGIVLDIDSPGGQVAGAFELAEEIRAARQVKPVWAHTSGQMLSGGYALGSAASRITTTISGAVGSVGVVYKHVDFSKMNERQGITVTPIFAGARKLDFDPDSPLSPEARADAEAEVARVYDIFANAVAEGRGLTVEAVKGTEARVYYGEKSIEVGLADEVATLADTVDAMQASFATAGASPGMSSAASVRASEGNEVSENTQTADAVDASAAGAGDVRDINAARDAGVDEGRQDAAGIVTICTIAGHSELAAGFLKEGLSRAQVEQRLVELAAQSSERTGEIDTKNTAADAAQAELTGGIEPTALVDTVKSRVAQRAGARG